MKLIKCEGEITTINGRSFRKPYVGEVIPKGHLRCGCSGSIYISSGDLAISDLVEVPTPIGEPFESHGSWWQKVEVFLLECDIEVLSWTNYDSEKVKINIVPDFMMLFHNIAIPCDAPAVATRPMTWGEAWDRDLWIKDHLGQIVSSKAYSRLIYNDVYADLLVSKSHRGPWYPAVMPWEGE